LAFLSFWPLRPAHATWKPEYAALPQWVQDWYEHAELTDAAAARLGFRGCCETGDVVKTQFRVEKDGRSQHWFYLKDGAWLQIPDDIVRWGESAPDNKPTLFALSHVFMGWPVGTLTCF
jgi:hypothetical protein